MNVLLIGSGGREHAMAWAVAASPLLTTLVCAPGNAGIAEVCACVPLAIDDHPAVVAFCRARRIDLVVVGPEAPLVAGIADALAKAGIKCFGPSQAAARLEGSKGFTKDLCDRRKAACSTCLADVHTCIARIGHWPKLTHTCAKCTARFENCYAKRYPKT